MKGFIEIIRLSLGAPSASVSVVTVMEANGFYNLSCLLMYCKNRCIISTDGPDNKNTRGIKEVG
jgi:hypothetical protein